MLDIKKIKSKLLWPISCIFTSFALIWVECFIYHVASNVWVNTGDDWVANAEFLSLVFLFVIGLFAIVFSIGLAFLDKYARRDLF